jgi:hypothetical protein
MRRILLLAATAALLTSLVAPATAGAKPVKPPIVNASACKLSATVVHIAVSWSNLRTTGGEFFINILPLTGKYEYAWNWRGSSFSGSFSHDIVMDTGDLANSVLVNLYNDKVNPPSFNSTYLFDDATAGEEILAC